MLQQNAQMLSSLGSAPGSGPSFGEHVMGRATNVGTAVGGPLAAAGAGMMGLDPFSLALKGGRMGFAGGGIAGAGLGAVGGLALGGGIAMAGGFVANQMAEGIQQQQKLNQMMSQSFTFRNQSGGTGFTSGQDRQIGSMLTSQQGWSGPGGSGSMVGFEELSRLASNMGSMGMAGGVRDVQQFGQRFKEMLTSVKTIAHEMQTSLEEAQKMMSDMRGAGVFGFKNAASFSGQIRAGAVAGNLATSEVTGMMGIGSQIARMTGGLGKQGARAGIEAITNIGAATQVGALSEEQIYNVTGQTGAEGRRAFATRMLEKSTEFLKTTQGRYFLASVSGANGHLNESSVQDYMSGGVGVEDTRRMANQNLSKIGRADFIRNEGRLRGAVAERFGGLETVMSMTQWLGSRGVSMDDPRARLYLQRVRGMGRDEADAMISMGQNLPEILQQRKQAAREDDVSRQISEARGHVGVEGLKRKFEEARSSVQTKLAEPARALFQAGTDMINDFVGKLTGEFTAVQYRHLDELTRAAKGLGAGGAIARQQIIGGIGKSAGMQGLASGSASSLLGAGVSQVENFYRDDAERFRDAGFGIHATSDQGLASQLKGIQSVGAGAKAGMDGKDSLARVGAKLGAKLVDELQAGAALRGTGEGFATISNFERTLKEAAAGGSTAAQAALKSWGKMSQKDKAEMVTSAYKGAGMDVSSMLTAPERRELQGLRAGPAGVFHEKVGSMMMPGEQGVLGQIAEFFGHGSTRGGTARAIGEAMDTEEYMNLGKRMLGKDESLRTAARKDVTGEMAQLQTSISKGGGSVADRARYQALGGLLASQKVDDIMSKAGVSRMEDLPAAEVDKLVKQFGSMGVSSREDLFKMVRAVGGNLSVKSDEQYKQWAQNVKESSQHRLETLQAGGLVGEGGGLTKTGQALLKGTSGAAQRFLSGFLGSAMAGIHADDRKSGERFLNAEAAQTTALSSMSTEEMRGLEQKLATVSPEAARMVRSERAGRQRLEMGRSRGGQAGGLKMVAGMLGEDVSNEDLRAAMKGGDKGIASLAQSLIEGSGITSADKRKELSGALNSYLKGDKGGAGKLQGLIEGDGELADAKRKKSLADAEGQNPVGAKTNDLLGKVVAALGPEGLLNKINGSLIDLKPAKEVDTKSG